MGVEASDASVITIGQASTGGKLLVLKNAPILKPVKVLLRHFLRLSNIIDQFANCVLVTLFYLVIQLSGDSEKFPNCTWNTLST